MWRRHGWPVSRCSICCTAERSDGDSCCLFIDWYAPGSTDTRLRKDQAGNVSPIRVRTTSGAEEGRRWKGDAIREADY